jgi:2,3-bisphosphoglycerate-dependent phosphoglycerate mutase
MQLYYIRHGQSANNALYDQSGSSKGRSHDPELTPTGVEQVQYLASFVSQSFQPVEKDPYNTFGFGFTQLYTSLMIRAVKTAYPIAMATALTLAGWEILHEEGGIFEGDDTTEEKIGLPGMPRSYFERHFPGMTLPDGVGEGGWYRARQFEPYDQRLPRARQFLADLLARHGGSQDRVAVVSHGGFFNLFMMALLGLDSRDGHRFVMNNAAISRFDFYEDHVAAVYINRTDHLPARLIT